MSRVIRPNEDDEESSCVSLEGVDCIAKTHLVFRLLFELLAALLAVFFGRWLFWWIFRINFLRQDNATLATYRIDDPARQRQHAWLAGVSQIASAICAVAFWSTKDPWFGILLALTAVAFIYLTVLFFLNRKDDPVSNSWD